MESVQPKAVQSQTQTTKPLNILETYQQRWDQLMENTTKEIEKIRQEERAMKANQTARR